MCGVVTSDSPLRSLPEALDPKQAMFLDGIRFSAEIVQGAMDSLREVLAQVTLGESHLHAVAMMFAWAVVDSSNRIRVLMEGMKRAGWVRRTEVYRSQIRELKSALPLRDSTQHLDGAIRRHTDVELIPPVWGSLAWFVVTEVDESNRIMAGEACFLRSGAVFPGAVGPGVVNPLGTVSVSKVDQIQLQAFDSTVSLSSLERAVEGVIERWEDRLRTQVPPNSPTRASDSCICISLR